MDISARGLADRALLVILDGFAFAHHDLKNAVKDADAPIFRGLFRDYPTTTIDASGLSVGLPEGVVGNSEVGHMNMGAGRPVRQDLVRINEAIAANTLKDRPRFREFLNGPSRRIHLLGLLSDGGVHSHIDHIIHVANLLVEAGKEVYLHAFMDGRDVPRDSGQRYIEVIQGVEGLRLASIQGRSIGMDRDRRWEKIHLAYETILGKGEMTDKTPAGWLEQEYANGRFDEFITPVLFLKKGAVGPEDSLFFVNFRPDRASQLTLAFNDPKFRPFRRDFIPPFFLCMSPYVSDEVELPILFDREEIPGGLSAHLSDLGYRQFKIAETEKYPHVTYFFNGGRKEAHVGEDFVLIPSPRDCATYDEKPEMSARLVCDRLLSAIGEDYKFLLVNFANGDMVGHTGNYEATLKAIEVLDECVGKLLLACEKRDMAMIVTADHGNSDQMIYSDGQPHTSHTDSPVPFCLYHPSLENRPLSLSPGPRALKDIAPSVLHVLGLAPPPLFEGQAIFG